jgi:hypothetical protein
MSKEQEVIIEDTWPGYERWNGDAFGSPSALAGMQRSQREDKATGNRGVGQTFEGKFRATADPVWSTHSSNKYANTHLVVATSASVWVRS